MAYATQLMGVFIVLKPFKLEDLLTALREVLVARKQLDQVAHDVTRGTGSIAGEVSWGRGGTAAPPGGAGAGVLAATLSRCHTVDDACGHLPRGADERGDRLLQFCPIGPV